MWVCKGKITNNENIFLGLAGHIKCGNILSKMGKKRRLTAQETLKQTRQDWGMTQRAFGEEIGRSERAIQDYESGRLPVPAGLARLINFIAKEREAQSNAS